MSRLQKIAEEFNVAVFITNHVCSDPSGGLTFVQDPKKVGAPPPLRHPVEKKLATATCGTIRNRRETFRAPPPRETSQVCEVSVSTTT